MALASSPLTSLSEMQRAQALERFTIIHPALEKQITQASLIKPEERPLRPTQR